MNKRNLASVLWFLAGWSGGGLLVGVMGLPAVLGFVPGIALGLWIRLDPGGFMWTRSVTGRRIVPINEYAAQLDKRVEGRPAAIEADSTRS